MSATSSVSDSSRGRLIRSPGISVLAAAPHHAFAIGSFFSPVSQRSTDSSGHTSIQSSPPVLVNMTHHSHASVAQTSSPPPGLDNNMSHHSHASVAQASSPPLKHNHHSHASVENGGTGGIDSVFGYNLNY